MKHLATLLFLIAMALPGLACLNEYNINKRGDINEVRAGLPIFFRAFDLKASANFLKQYDLQKREIYDYKEMSDAAVHLTKMGRYPEALELLQWLNARHPNEYTIVANLGTLYELSGEVDSASHYISEGIRLNQDSHEGSEWVHLAILEAKRKIQTEPDWVASHRVLDLRLPKPFPQYSKPYNSVLDTLEQIAYQLKERVPFSPDDDLILANIFKEYGQLLATHLSVESGYIALRIAREYDARDQFGIDDELTLLLPYFTKHELEVPDFQEHFPSKKEYEPGKRSSSQNSTNPRNWLNIWWWIGGGLIGIVLLMLLIRSSRRNRPDK